MRGKKKESREQISLRFPHRWLVGHYGRYGLMESMDAMDAMDCMDLMEIMNSMDLMAFMDAGAAHSL